MNKFITEDYISFDTAILLKEKGFNCPCRQFMTDLRTMEYASYEDWNSSEHRATTSVPTLQLAMKWLREVHNIYISIYLLNRDSPVIGQPVYTCDIATNELSSKEGHLRGMWQTYEEAAEEAIKHCLTLIK